MAEKRFPHNWGNGIVSNVAPEPLRREPLPEYCEEDGIMRKDMQEILRQVFERQTGYTVVQFDNAGLHYKYTPEQVVPNFASWSRIQKDSWTEL